MALIVLFSACGGEVPVSEVQLTDLEGQAVTIDPAAGRLTVLFFLAPECPLCLNYTRTFKQMEETYASDSVQFIGIFSGKWPTAEEARTFQLRHGLLFPMLMDPEMRLADRLGATVTPEAFLLDRSGQVLYSGSIDNWVNAIGKKKQEVTEHYLENAIAAALLGKAVSSESTKAVGCLIE